MMMIQFEGIYKFVEDLAIPDPSRNFVIHTGSAGFELLNATIKEEIDKNNLKDAAHFLWEKNLLTKDQRDNLKMMIDSPDTENREVAKAAILELSRTLDKRPRSILNPVG